MATRRRAAAPSADPLTASPADAPTAAPRVLKKYPNRRLYDTQASAYVTLADVKTMVLAGEGFEVRDAKSGDDITRSILLQIILEEETAGAPLFSTPMLEQIIRFYGQAMQGVLQDYLAKNLQTFTELQQQFRVSGGMPFTPEAWTEWLRKLPTASVAPLPGFEAYVEQSQALLRQMQEQMAGFAAFGKK